MVGMWLQLTALSWLIYRLTESAAFVAIVLLGLQGPGLFLGPIVGVLADRYRRRHILVMAQTLTSIPALALGALTLSGLIQPWHIMALALVAGVARAFEIPTRQAFVPSLVEGPDLANAIALNSALFNVARLIGPAVAGAAIPLVGEGWCFLANGLACAWAVGALVAIRLPPGSKGRLGRRSVLDELLEGLRYVTARPTLLALLAGLLISSIAGMPYSVLLPSFSERILGGGPRFFGYLQGAVGLGALVGALALASRVTVAGLERWVVAATVTFGAGLMTLSRVRSIGLAVVVLVPVGFGFMIQAATTNTLIQTLAPEDLRGRIMSIHTTILLGVFPFAGLAFGALADRIGEPIVLLTGGFLVLVGGVLMGPRILVHAAKSLAEPT